MAPGRMSDEVREGLRALIALGESRPDTFGHVAQAIEWIRARAHLKPQAHEGLPATHREALEALVAAWEQEHGRRYPRGSRDAKAVRELRALPDWSLELGLRRWRTLLAAPYWRSRGIALPDLLEQWARLASREGGSLSAQAAERVARALERSPDPEPDHS